MNLLRPGDEESYLVVDGGLSMGTKRSQDKTDNTMRFRGRGTEIIRRKVLEMSPQCIVEAYPATRTYFPSF